MVVNFSTVDMYDKPVLVLKTLNGKVLQTLGYAINAHAKIYYNEVSELKFDIPAFVDGVATPNYDKIVGMTMVDLVGYGQFIMMNPVVVKDGIREMKSCTAYSLEYEFTRAKISLDQGTYNFWNPVAPAGTILGIILEYMPDWKIGSVDSTLIGKYRTFEEKNVNVYNLMKSKLQDTYNCIFDFDTYNRKINVKDVSSSVATAPVFISLENLAKEIEIEEDTENIFTCLDVNGAEGVSIRSVNPLGTNKIYNLDYYMNDTNFSESIIQKWNQWKSDFSAKQLTYYNISIERALLTSRYLTENAALTDLKGEYTSLDNQRAVAVQAIAQGIDESATLSKINRQMSAKQSEISAQNTVIENLKEEIESVAEQLSAINKEIAFTSYFSAEEMSQIRPYIKEDSIQETTFTVPSVQSYTDPDISGVVANVSTNINNASITKIYNQVGKDMYSIVGGKLTLSCGNQSYVAEIIRGSLERKSNSEFVMSLYMGSGNGFNVKDNSKFSFASGSLSLVGTALSIADNTSPDKQFPDSYGTGTTLSFTGSQSKLYFTRNTTEYEQRAVEWELFDYGMDCLNKLAYPSYSFKLDAANFLSLREFDAFTRQLELGLRTYIDTQDNVLTPIFIGVDIEFDSPDSFSLEFGDKYSASDSTFNLVDLLNKSISMGSSVDYSKYNYNAFIDSGASTSVRDFMKSAFDVSLNAIMSSTGQGVSWDESGLHLRKYKDDNSGEYEDEQIWIINNNIVFTDDNWNSAKMAIGKFTDINAGDCWGIVAPNIVGTLLAGENLVIESVKKDGGVSVFKVDGDGAVLHNARFDIENGVSHIMLDPTLGFAIGNYPVLENVNGVERWDEDNAKFWVDTAGNVHFKGTLEGCEGLFTGSLQVGGSTGFRVDDQGNLSIGGTATNPNFYVDANGNMTAKSGSFKGTVDASALRINGQNILTNTTNGMATGSSQIDSRYLNLGNITLDGNKGDIEMTGNIDMDGSITLGGNIYISGNIEWNSSNTPVCVLYSQYGDYSVPTGIAYSAFPSTSSQFSTYYYWHRTFVSSSDIYASYSYDGGSTWTAPMKQIGEDGNAANVTEDAIFDILTDGGSKFGLFSDVNGQLYINAQYIKTGTLSANQISAGTIDATVVSLSNNYGGFCAGQGTMTDENGIVSTTNGAKMYGGSNKDSDHFIIVTDAGSRMSSYNNHIATSAGECTMRSVKTPGGSGSTNYISVSTGGVSTSAPVGSLSDRRLKRDISYEVDKYERFFMELKPSFFKFSSDESGRSHTGFIAQDVEESLLNTGLSANDFAGLRVGNDNGNLSELSNQYGLAYSEFIALNTHMIHKLYHRIDQLETELEELKGE